MQKRVVLGRIVGAFGVGGWVKVESFTDPLDNILNYPVWQLGRRGEWQSRKHLDARITAKGVQARIERIDDRTEADLWRGTEIAVDRDELPPTEPGEFYWNDLIGLRAIALDGSELGEIVEIRSAPAHPLLLIRGERVGDKPGLEHWVPLVSERLKSVDLANGSATIDWLADW